ncbi:MULTISPECIES: hypothetical protein [unclassified Frigoribacterium]|uniref:hypothetical protein n=1 Tax=unclassified Frigoribacterium TaxID=2627005 RepID=UPI0005BB660D|nr:MULTISPECIES: hypothetical protein [unclassified Frigoribacterium]KIU03776.1 hypothetical protein SZ60_03305 [Frigoribacterium sp. MEB024]KQN45589.1 hypothetical protein ASE87_03210 [Frigoribacterium sp. Leaf44]
MDPATGADRGTATRGRRAAPTLLAVVGTAAFVLGGALTVQAGTARALEPVPETGLDGHLVLADELVGTEDIAPAAPGRWQIATDVTTGDRVALGLELVSSGSLVDDEAGLTLGVETCDVEWQQVETTPLCATGARTVTAPTRASSFVDGSPSWPVRSVGSTGRVFVLVSLGLAGGRSADDTSSMGRTARVGVGITATALDPVETLPAEPVPEPTVTATPGDPAEPGPDATDEAAPGPAIDGSDDGRPGDGRPVGVTLSGVAAPRSLAFTGGLSLGPAIAGAGALLVGLALHLRGRRRAVTS